MKVGDVRPTGVAALDSEISERQIGFRARIERGGTVLITRSGTGCSKQADSALTIALHCGGTRQTTMERRVTVRCRT